jgi:hypothetical protein
LPGTPRVQLPICPCARRWPQDVIPEPLRALSLASAAVACPPRWPYRKRAASSKSSATTRSPARTCAATPCFSSTAPSRMPRLRSMRPPTPPKTSRRSNPSRPAQAHTSCFAAPLASRGLLTQASAPLLPEAYAAICCRSTASARRRHAENIASGTSSQSRPVVAAMRETLRAGDREQSKPPAQSAHPLQTSPPSAQAEKSSIPSQIVQAASAPQTSQTVHEEGATGGGGAIGGGAPPRFGPTGGGGGRQPAGGAPQPGGCPPGGAAAMLYQSASTSPPRAIAP